MRLTRWHPPLERSVRSAHVAWLLLTSLGCATVLGSWDYGLLKDNLPHRRPAVAYRVSIVSGGSGPMRLQTRRYLGLLS